MTSWRSAVRVSYIPMDQLSKLTLFASCEKLLALAARRVLPTLIPLQGHTHEWGFEYDFIAKAPCEEGVLRLITEEMRRMVHEALPFESLNMMPQNAAQFLQKKQPLQAEACRDYPGNVVPLCKLGDFYDIAPLELCSTTKELQNFALYEMLFLPDSCVRIRGVACNDKKALKSYLKQLERAKEHDPVRLAEELELVMLLDGEVIWQPNGVRCKKTLENYVARRQQALGFSEIECTQPLEGVEKLFDKCRANKKALPYRFCVSEVRHNDELDGLFLAKTMRSRSHYCCCEPVNLQQELISSLHFMKQIASILDRESSFLLLQRGKDEDVTLTSSLRAAGYPFEVSRSNATQIELHVLDERGRSWPISKLLVRHNTLPIVECTALFSYERILALVLEKGEGIGPFIEKIRMEEEPTLESESRDSSS